MYYEVYIVFVISGFVILYVICTVFNSVTLRSISVCAILKTPADLLTESIHILLIYTV